MPNDTAESLAYLRHAYWRTRLTAIDLAKIQKFGGFQSVGIVGAGIMGASIAGVHLEKLIPVTLVDANPNVLEQAKCELQIRLPTQLIEVLLSTSTNLSDLAHCDLVIECIVEKSAAKQALLRELEELVSDIAIIASNTSTIPIGRLAKGLQRPGRFCGIHFCHPLSTRPLVEVIAGPATLDEVSSTAVTHIAMLDRLPIRLEDGHGFVVNRLLFPYLGEGMSLLADGVPAEQIDQAAEDFGMAKGPLKMLDGIGLDTALHSGLIMSEVAAQRMADMALLVALVKAGDLGEKTGAGVYTHPSLELNARVRELMAGRFKPAAKKTYNAAQLCNRLMLSMILEAVRIVEDRKVADPSVIDLAAVYGLGFPATRGGPIAWADQLGAQKILSLLGEMTDMGQRGRPPALLIEMAAEGQSFRKMQA